MSSSSVTLSLTTTLLHVASDPIGEAAKNCAQREWRRLFFRAGSNFPSSCYLVVVFVITRILERTKCTHIYAAMGRSSVREWHCLYRQVDTWDNKTTWAERCAFNQFDFNIYCAMRLMRRFNIRFGWLWSWHKNYATQVNRINLSQTKCWKRKRHLLLKWSTSSALRKYSPSLSPISLTPHPLRSSVHALTCFAEIFPFDVWHFFFVVGVVFAR